MLTTSLTAKIEITVTTEQTAEKVGSGSLPVFSTPSLAALMEQTCVLCLQPHLDPETTTVGTSLNLKHTSATPVGMKVTCECTLTEIDGKRLVFDVRANDECGLIGQCVHERFIVNTDRFMQKTNDKLK
jgi:Predicted thioesterase